MLHVSSPSREQRNRGTVSICQQEYAGNTTTFVSRVTAPLGGRARCSLHGNQLSRIDFTGRHGICLYQKKARGWRETFSAPGFGRTRTRGRADVRGLLDLFENTSTPRVGNGAPRGDDTRRAWKRADSLISPRDAVDQIHIAWARLSIQYASIIW